MALKPEDVALFRRAVEQMSASDKSKPAGEPGPDGEPSQDIAALISLLESRRQVVVSTNPAINEILIARGPGPLEGGYNDGGSGGYSEFIEDDQLAGYNDVQEPQPGGGYADYTQWIDRTDGLQGPRYNDGPQDLDSLRQIEALAGPLVNIARDRQVLSELRSIAVEIKKGGH